MHEATDRMMDASGAASTPVEKATGFEPTRRPGFWRRPLAMGLDGLILGCVGFPLGMLFFDPLSRLGAWGRLVGFLISASYFGVLNSRVGGGQTLGKRALRIQVVQSSGPFISVRRSIARFVIVGAPYFANGAALPASRTPMAVSIVLSILVFGVGGAIVYLYIFNRPTRQSLHDLLVGSSVVLKRPGSIPIVPLWRGHVAILAAILCITTLSGIAIGKLMWSQLRMPELMKVLGAVETARGVQAASVSSGRFWGPQGTGEYFSVIALLNEEPDSLEGAVDRIAGIVLAEFPDVMSKDRLAVGVQYGFDIGIAQARRKLNTVLPPEEWMKRMSKGPRA